MKKNLERLISQALEQSQPRDRTRIELLKDAFERAELLCKNGQFDESIDLYTRMIDVLPLPDFYNQRGNALTAVNRLRDAIDDYSEAISRDAADSDYFTNRGNAYLRNSNLELAIKDLDHAIQLNPNSKMAINSRGLVKQERGEIAEAIDDFLLAIKIDATYASAKHNLSRLYFKEGRLKDAIRTIESIEPLQDDRTVKLKQKISEAMKCRSANSQCPPEDVTNNSDEDTI